MWCILIPQLLDFIGEENAAIKMTLEKTVHENDVLELISGLENQEFTNVMKHRRRNLLEAGRHRK